MDWFESANEYLIAWKARDASWRKEFNPGALRALELARSEANRLNRNYIGTEHLLLGLTKLAPESPDNLFRKLGLDIEHIGSEVERSAGAGTIPNEPVSIPYTPRMRKVLKSAKEDAKAIGSPRVGPGHLLSGLLVEREGCTAAVFKNLGMDRDNLRNHALNELRPTGASGVNPKAK